MKYILAALFIGLSSTVSAAPIVTGEAEVEWSSRPHDKIIVGDKLWNCEATLCRGQLVDSAPLRLRTCFRLSSQAGRVVAFRTPAGNLAEEDLSRCNRER